MEFWKSQVIELDTSSYQNQKILIAMYIRNQTSDINFEVLLTAGRCVKKRCSISCCYCHCCSGVLNQLASINDFWYYDTLFLCLFQHQCKKLYLRDKLGIQNKGTFQISFIMVNLCLGKTKFRMTSVSGLHRCKNLWYVFFASLVHAQVWLLFNGPLAFLFSFFLTSFVSLTCSYTKDEHQFPIWYLTSNVQI